MPKRFNQLIKGCGWDFFESQCSNWNKFIFYHERSLRIGTKKLIISVLGDVIRTYLEA